ncbi:PAS domain-containing protein [Rhizobium sp. PL01]|uniref:hybrid sensor histidine kinase/response regulator n=1 Tax=Rhizobium sp. PL01 TaxID=3085631 RepID=UPI002982801A|nr:PAS domain-containing protein [Rhizobium sp. PL01]MDW5318552.1 PAS domain-containing protein [Rhizobium sp. PL01]
MATTVDLTKAKSWPLGGGEMGERIRAFDWSMTSLGPISDWPTHLRIKVNSIVNSPIPQVIMWGDDHVMIYNDSYVDIAGGYHPKALGGRVSDIWPEIWDWNNNVLTAAFRGDVQSFRDQPMALRRRGEPETVIFDLFYTPIYDEDGVVDGVLCTVLENTEKHQAISALAISRAELASLTNALPILVGFIDLSLTYRFANDAYKEWFGRSPGEIVGRPVREIIGEEYFEKRLPLIQRAMAGETIVTDASIQRPDGHERHAEVRYVPRQTAVGIDGIYVLIIDIDDRKRSELELAESNLRFRTAMDVVHGVLWTNSADGRMKGEQPGWAALTGQSPEDYQDYGWATSVHPDDSGPTVDAWNKAVAERRTFVHEHRVRRHDGVWRSFLIRANPIFSDNGEIIEWVGVHTDITEQRLAERALRERSDDLERQVVHRQRAEEQLRQLNETLEDRVAEESEQRRKAEAKLQQAQKLETIGKLTGGVAHDFNNLLQVVSGNLQLLMKDVTGNDRAERRVINALAGVNRGAKLASQLLAFGRRQALDPKVINVGKFVRGMDDMLRRSLGEAVEIETVIAGGLWNCLIDPANVENALLNLAINARDAMNGTGKLTIEAGNAYLDDAYAQAHDDVTPGQYVVLSVSDTGAGIPEEILDTVFEPFFSTKEEGKGSGLGLSMVHGFVRQSGGHIKLYSEVGHGTTVKLYLPRATDKEDREVDLRSGPVIGGTETILVVEDDNEVRETVVETLTDLGYKVLKAPNADAALIIIEAGIAIDLLFTDVVMPGTLKSPELARKARERQPDLAVLYTSGYTENSIVHGGRLDAGVELLSKPYTREALASKLRQVLANRAQKYQPSPAAPLSIEPVQQEASATLSILLVEDDVLIRINTADMIAELGHDVIEAGTGAEAIALLETRSINVLVTDLGLPDMGGAQLADEARARQPALGVVYATGHDRHTGELPLEAVVVTKPYGAEDLRSALEQAWIAVRRE